MNDFMDIIQKLLPDEDKQALAHSQLLEYHHGEGKFSRPMLWAAAKSNDAWRWWKSFGSHCPELQSVAIKVLSLVATASSCERSWSTFDFIHSKRRNRLTAARANDLVYCFSNLRLRDREADRAEVAAEQIPEPDSDDDRDQMSDSDDD